MLLTQLAALYAWPLASHAYDVLSDVKQLHFTLRPAVGLVPDFSPLPQRNQERAAALPDLTLTTRSRNFAVEGYEACIRASRRQGCCQKQETRCKRTPQQCLLSSVS